MIFHRKFKAANPDDVYFVVLDGEPCFYRYLAFKHKKNGGKEEYNEKDLDRIARHKFDIERSRQKYIEKYWWEVVEQDNCYILRFYPLLCQELLHGQEARKQSESLDFILQLLGEEK